MSCFLFAISFILVYVKHKKRRLKNDFCCSSFSSFSECMGKQIMTEKIVMSKIEYHFDEKKIKSNYLIIKNCLDRRRLCKVTIDDKLFKLLLLLPNEVKEVKISPQLKNKIKVIDITE